MKQNILFIFITFCVTASFAQTTIVRCGSHEATQYEAAHSASYSAIQTSVFEQAKAWKQQNIQKTDPDYIIPVVVHIVYNTPAQNLDDQVILDQIQVLNEDYGRMNPDSVNLRSQFNTIAGNPKIRFVLASVDPDGNPTTGITRTQTATTTFGDVSSLLGSFAGLEKIKSTANGGINPWNQSKYLNIWVGNMSVSLFGQEQTVLLGYATPPPNLPNWPVGSTPQLNDGVVIQYQCFGRNNPNPMTANYVVAGRTVTHEVGHYLGLRHIWGDGDCTQEDGIDDTPNADASSNQDCDITKNTCIDNILTLGDLPDMIENFMDYSSEDCQNAFTRGQVELMHGILEGPRYELTHNNPAALTVNEIATSSISIYPNPVTNILNITSTSNTSELTLSDAQGRELKKVNTQHHQQQIDFSGYDSGIYFLSNGNSKSIQKIIKL